MAWQAISRLLAARLLQPKGWLLCRARQSLQACFTTATSGIDHDTQSHNSAARSSRSLSVLLSSEPLGKQAVCRQQQGRPSQLDHTATADVLQHVCTARLQSSCPLAAVAGYSKMGRLSPRQ